MKKILIIGAAMLGVYGFVAIPTYNDLAGENQKVLLSYSNVQNMLRRQAELIPNLANVVEAAATHENKTFTNVAQARNDALTAIKAIEAISPADMAKNPALQKQMLDAATSANRAMVVLKQTTEAYPTLQANANFRDLMKELEGSLNRVTVARKYNQDAIFTFNSKLVKFPSNVIASTVGFSELPYYKASEADQNAPRVFEKK